MGLITRYCHHLKLIFPSCVLCYFKLYVTKPAYVQKLLCKQSHENEVSTLVEETLVMSTFHHIEHVVHKDITTNA